MSFVVVAVVVLGIAIGVTTFFIVRSIVNPKKVATLADLVKQGKHPPAIRLARKILAKEPRNSDAHYFLGLAYMADGKPELALMELKAVNQIGQFGGYCREVPFRKKIAELFVKFNQPEEALKEYLLLIKREPAEASHYREIGRLFEERGQNDKAASFYRKAVELAPRDADAHFRLGFLLYRAKLPVEARSKLETAIKLNPENYQAHFYLGRLLKDNHDYAGALASFEKAQKDGEYKMKALVERGACFMSMNNYDRAVIELERAIRLAEDDEGQDILYAWYFLAICHEKSRRIESAIEQWDKIHAKRPNFRDVSEKLGQYHEFRQDDRMKDFMTANQEEFMRMCRDVTANMNLMIQDISPIPNGCQAVAVENQSKWRNARKIPKLIRFLRVAEMVDESTVKALHEEMRKLNIIRGILVTSSTFSRLAMDFAESRPVELMNKDRLRQLLEQGEPTGREAVP